LQIHIFVIRGTHFSISIIENKWWEGLDRICRQAAEFWTLKGRHSRFIYVSSTSWVVDGLKLWPFESVTTHEILAIIFNLVI
jgi:hypothetical protein